MISAAEALLLPSAELSDEERAAADDLESKIDIHVRKNMERRGCEFQTTETRNNVIADVNQRLKSKGYLPQWAPRMEEHKLNRAMVKHVGFDLSLAPSDAAYQEAARKALS